MIIWIIITKYVEDLMAISNLVDFHSPTYRLEIVSGRKLKEKKVRL